VYLTQHSPGAELVEHRRVLHNVGGNLNDVSRHANSTGELHAATARVQDLVARAVEKVERTVAQCRIWR
jgi:hypothetical protein